MNEPNQNAAASAVVSNAKDSGSKGHKCSRSCKHYTPLDKNRDFQTAVKNTKNGVIDVEVHASELAKIFGIKQGKIIHAAPCWCSSYLSVQLRLRSCPDHWRCCLGGQDHHHQIDGLRIPWAMGVAIFASMFSWAISCWPTSCFPKCRFEWQPIRRCWSACQHTSLFLL